MSFKNKRPFFINKERLVIGFVLILICIGITLNYQLVNKIRLEENTYNEVSEEEFEMIRNISKNTELDINEIDRNKIENKLLNMLDEMKEDTKDKGYNIGRIYYFLALNNYALGVSEYEKTEKYYLEAVKSLEKSNSFFYLIDTYNSLMNMSYWKGDQTTGLMYANHIYDLFQLSNNSKITSKGEKNIRANVLSGLITSTSEYGLLDMAKEYYDELSKIKEENTDIQSNLSIYSMFQYNINIKNYPEALKFAQEYVKFFEGDDEITYGGAHIYLLEALIYNNEFENIENVISIIEKSYKEINHPMYWGTLEKLKGLYYRKMKSYDLSLEHFEKAIQQFESIDAVGPCVIVSNQILEIKIDRNEDIKNEVVRALKYDKEYNHELEAGNISDALVNVTFEKFQEENIKLKAETEISTTVNEFSKKINVVYVLIILLLIIVTDIVKQEVSRRKEKERELKEIIKIDFLTKAYSKQFIFNEINSLIDNKEKFSMLLFDLDNFKKINDTYGHNFGDEVLIKIVASVKESIDKGDSIGRFGGEEFIVIFKEYENIEEKIQIIRESIAKILWGLPNFSVTISGGVKNWNGESIEKILSDSDKLLYEAKRSGKNKIKF